MSDLALKSIVGLDYDGIRRFDEKNGFSVRSDGVVVGFLDALI